ncbi:MAG: cation transporter [Rhodocyclales bacterium]|nr:cation transporter [Rhodocyclales bacterium]
MPGQLRSERRSGRLRAASAAGIAFALDLDHLGHELAAVPGVNNIHDLHVWRLSGEGLALSAHVRVDRLADWPTLLPQLLHMAQDHGIGHATFQPETIPQSPLLRQERTPT